MKVVAIVGMAGSGKSEVARLFRDRGFAMVRFGDVTDEEVRKLRLPLTEENERPVREHLRKEHGMAAYAELSVPRIDAGSAIAFCPQGVRPISKDPRCHRKQHRCENRCMKSCFPCR